MGRLIDADALMERKQEEHGYYDITDSEFEELVKTQPTAYDVEKVVERLEKERICLEDNYGDEVICIGAHDAIDIVKRGGVE
jgi:hypothetical protein